MIDDIINNINCDDGQSSSSININLFVSDQQHHYDNHLITYDDHLVTYDDHLIIYDYKKIILSPVYISSLLKILYSMIF